MNEVYIIEDHFSSSCAMYSYACDVTASVFFHYRQLVAPYSAVLKHY